MKTATVRSPLTPSEQVLPVWSICVYIFVAAWQFYGTCTGSDHAVFWRRSKMTCSTLTRRTRSASTRWSVLCPHLTAISWMLSARVASTCEFCGPLLPAKWSWIAKLILDPPFLVSFFEHGIPNLMKCTGLLYHYRMLWLIHGHSTFFLLCTLNFCINEALPSTPFLNCLSTYEHHGLLHTPHLLQRCTCSMSHACTLCCEALLNVLSFLGSGRNRCIRLRWRAVPFMHSQSSSPHVFLYGKWSSCFLILFYRPCALCLILTSFCVFLAAPRSLATHRPLWFAEIATPFCASQLGERHALLRAAVSVGRSSKVLTWFDKGRIQTNWR